MGERTVFSYTEALGSAQARIYRATLAESPENAQPSKREKMDET